MLELARGVQRIDVHDDEPARNAPKSAIGYCRTFGSMIAMRSPRFRPAALQPRGECARELSTSPYVIVRAELRERELRRERAKLARAARRATDIDRD